MKRIATNSENFTLCSINLNIASIRLTGNVQLEFKFNPCVMKQLWYEIVDRSINSFLHFCQNTYWCPVDLVFKNSQRKNQLVLDLLAWQVMWCMMTLFRPSLKGIVGLRMNKQCWQSEIDPFQGVQAQHIAATYPPYTDCNFPCY